MPTLLIIFGLRFFFYLDEHQPIHVHIERNGKKAKIELCPNIKLVYKWSKRTGGQKGYGDMQYV